MSSQLSHLQNTVSALVPLVEQSIKALTDTKTALAELVANSDSPEAIAAIDAQLGVELANLQAAFVAVPPPPAPPVPDAPPAAS